MASHNYIEPSQPKNLVVRWALKVNKFVITSMVMFCVFVTLLMINVVQVVAWLALHKVHLNAFRKINFYLYSFAAQEVTTVLEWYNNVQLRIFYPDQESYDEYSKKPQLIIGNHHYPIDAFFYWLVADHFRTMGSTKAIVKEDLKLIPLYGWCFALSEFVFLKRNWRDDQNTFGPSLDALMSYPYPVQLLFCPEGTRYTEKKHQVSVEFCRKNGKGDALRHHLYPRVKGMAMTLKHLRENYYSKYNVYNYEMIVPSHQDQPETVTALNFFRGRPFTVDVYIEKLPMDRLPGPQATEPEYEKFLYELFLEKDKLIDAHRDNGTFPRCYYVKKKKSLRRFLKFLLINLVASGSLTAWALNLALTTQYSLLSYSIWGFTATVYAAIIFAIVKLQSSSYGMNTSSSSGHVEDKIKTN